MNQGNRSSRFILNSLWRDSREGERAEKSRERYGDGERGRTRDVDEGEGR